MAEICEGDLVRVGVDIGGTDTKIGLVNAAQQLVAFSSAPTHAERPAAEVLADIAQRIRDLLSKQNVRWPQCQGVGFGVPGTVNPKLGLVPYSNNLGWADVPFIETLKPYLPTPIRIANDADCAALGELAAGAGKGFRNIVMVTLGTGVGGGVILDGRLLHGSELGHMVLVENGELCTCGRRGCLEAYASATALKRDVRRITGFDMEPKAIFEAAASGDSTAKKIVDFYIHRLGEGIVNIVNLFRPQILLLGGGLSHQGETLLKPIREMVGRSCFGGAKAGLPEIRVAPLGNRAGMIGAASLFQDLQKPIWPNQNG